MRALCPSTLACARSPRSRARLAAGRGRPSAMGSPEGAASRCRARWPRPSAPQRESGAAGRKEAGEKKYLLIYPGHLPRNEGTKIFQHLVRTLFPFCRISGRWVFLPGAAGYVHPALSSPALHTLLPSKATILLKFTASKVHSLLAFEALWLKFAFSLKKLRENPVEAEQSTITLLLLTTKPKRGRASRAAGGMLRPRLCRVSWRFGVLCPALSRVFFQLSCWDAAETRRGAGQGGPEQCKHPQPTFFLFLIPLATALLVTWETILRLLSPCGTTPISRCGSALSPPASGRAVMLLSSALRRRVLSAGRI